MSGSVAPVGSWDFADTGLLDLPSVVADTPAPVQPTTLAQNKQEDGFDWRSLLPNTPDEWLRTLVPGYSISKDFIDALRNDPVGTLAQIWGGVVGAGHTVLDMAVGLFQVGQTAVAGLLEIVNVLAVGAQMPFTSNPQLVSQWAHDHSTAVSQGAADLLKYVVQQGDKIPGQVAQALERELTVIAELNARGDPKSKYEAAERFSHLVTSIFLAVEGGVSLARSGVSMSRAFAQSMRANVGGTTQMLGMINTLRRLTPEQLPQALRFVDELAANPAAYRGAPTALKIALREGLSPYASNPAVQRALRQVDDLDGLARSAAQTTPRIGSGNGTGTGVPAASGNVGTTGSTGALTTVATNPSLEVAANYVQGIGNVLVRQGVTAEANRLLQAGQVIDLDTMARLQAQVQAQLAVNTRQAIAGQVFTDPALQAALRQRLADMAGSDPSQNAALANSPKAVLAQAQELALDQLNTRLFQGSGVAQGARNAFRQQALAWAQQATPDNPAAALEKLLAQPQWQNTLLRDVAIDQISGQSQAGIARLQASKPQAAAELATLRLHLAQGIDAQYASTASLKNLLAQEGGRARTALVRDAVAAQLGGDAPLATAVKKHAINTGLGERALVDLVTSPQARVAFMKESLLAETLRAPGERLNAAERALLSRNIDAKLAQLGSDAARAQYLKDLSNSGQALRRMSTPDAAAPNAAAPVVATPAVVTPAVVTPAAGTASTRSPAPLVPEEPARPTAPVTPPVTPPTTTPAVPDVQLAGGVFQRGNQIVLRSADLEVALPPGYRFGPIEDFANLGGPNSGYTTISGHGTLMPNAFKQAGAPTFATVPEGTRVVLLTPPGAVLGSRLGEYVDNRTFTVNYGIDTPNIVPIRVPYRVLEAGETLPNAIVTPPAGLNVPARPDVITVSSEQEARALSQMLKPNMGTVVINICAPVQGAPNTRWSGLQFEDFGVVNRFSLKRSHYGLPSPNDAPSRIDPQASPQSRSTPPPAGEEPTPAVPPTPALDTSGWNLTMGEVVFGKQPVMQNPFPWPTALGSANPATPTAPLVMTDPLTGQPLRVGANGQLEAVQPDTPSNITARQLAVDELTLPQRQQLGRIGFQRTGPRLSIKVGDYSVVANVWAQRDPGQVIDWSAVVRDLPRAVGNEPVASSADLVERVARELALRAPAGSGWSVQAAGPAPVLGADSVGVNLGNYIELGNLQSAVNSGAVLYDPAAPLGQRYRLNTIPNTSANGAGEQLMLVPLEVTVGWRAAVSPTSLPGMPPLPVSVGLSRSSESKVVLSGAVNPELLASLNAGLNNPLAVQIWHDAGSVDYRNVRQINFALPGTLAREGSYNLPSGWQRLENEMMPREQRDNQAAWSTFTTAAGTVGGSLFGVGGRAGFFTQRVERVATDYGPDIARVYDQPAAPGVLARPSSVTSFTFIAGVDGTSGAYTLVEVLPSEASATRRMGEYVQSDVKGQLIVPQRGTVEMPGSVLNALNGYPVVASDVPRIVAFLRALDPAGASAQANAEQVYGVVSRIRTGEPLGAEATNLLREAVRRYAEPIAP